MSILSYNKFINEKLLSEGLREMKFVLSKRLIEVLKKIEHKISDELLSLHNDLDSKTKQTFVDISKTSDDSLSFIQSNKATELLNINTEEKYGNYDKNLLNDIDLSHPVYNQYRSEVRIGRFINSVFGPTKFPSGARYEPGVIPNDVESFVRLYRAKFNQDEKFELMELLSGSKISHFYNCENYKNDYGSLGGSCMSDVSGDYFDIYVYNNNVSMLVLYENESKNKITGRAIVWKNLLQPEGRTFMDRIYTNNSSDEQIFKEYAINKGWLYKGLQSYGPDGAIEDPINNTQRTMKLVCQLNPEHHDYYPYMDTMIYYNPNNGKISNRTTGMIYLLQSTGGDYESLDDDYNEVWSNYHNEDIIESDAKWCEFGEDWVYETEAIKVYNTGGKYAVPGHPDIVRCNIPNVVDKHFEKSKCVWSDFLNTWIFYSSAIKVWKNFDRTKSVIDHKKREGIAFAKINNEYWSMDLVNKIDDNQYELKQEVSEPITRPVNAPRGWHRMIEFIDEQGNIFKRGQYVGKKEI